MLADIVFSAGLPYAAYLLLSHEGYSTVYALAGSACVSAAYTIYGVIRERRIHALAVIVLAATAASIAASIAFTSPFFALAKGSLITGSVALAFGVSLLLRRPLVYHLALVGQDEEARAEAAQLWAEQPRYRTVLRRITMVWAVALLIEAATRIVLIPLLPVAVFLVVSELLWLLTFAAVMAWSWRYGRREIDKLPPLAAADPAPG